MIRKLINKLFYFLLPPKQYAKLQGVKIGKGTYISTKGFSSEPYLISIGNNVRIAKEVLFLTHGGMWTLRNIDPDLKKLDYYGKIKIGNNVYIGQRTIIMPGVTIGNNCVIGAASIVNKSIPDNTIAAGSPIRFVSTMEDYIKGLKNKCIEVHHLPPKQKHKYLKSLDDSNFIKKPFIKKEK